MRKLTRNILLLSMTALAFLFMAWGYNGHHKINQSAANFFTPEMQQFMSWAVTLAEHASDADARKDEDPDEGPRHYIDIDNYPGFIASGKIYQSYDSVVAQYGEDFIIDNGILPWATKRTYDSLVSSFTRFDWAKAVLFASDLGHYVADAHNPLHITKNYNGQFTDNYGIHSRYETGMINAFLNEIEITGEEISLVPDVEDYIFNYIYENYIYVDSIMLADDYAEAVAGNTSSSTYKAALWGKTKNFTIPLFNKASKSLAELIFTAWAEAGKPDMNSGPGIFEFIPENNNLFIHLTPNPVKNTATVQFNLLDQAEIECRVFDYTGTIVQILQKENLPAGAHEIQFKTADLPEGIYCISICTGRFSGCCKMIKIAN